MGEHGESNLSQKLQEFDVNMMTWHLKNWDVQSQQP